MEDSLSFLKFRSSETETSLTIDVGLLSPHACRKIEIGNSGVPRNFVGGGGFKKFS